MPPIKTAEKPIEKPPARGFSFFGGINDLVILKNNLLMFIDNRMIV